MVMNPLKPATHQGDCPPAVNISAVGGTQIEQQGFDDLSEMASYIPGLNVVDQGGRRRELTARLASADEKTDDSIEHHPA